MSDLQNSPGTYPEDDAMQSFISKRNRTGFTWQVIFQIATIIGVLALIALLYNIIIGSFGFVAMQNQVDPNSLILGIDEARMLEAPNTVSSEDDNELANGIIGNPNAIGFFGYAYYAENTDTLKKLTVDGVSASAETAESGEYGLSRPLFIYSAESVMEDNPEVAAFINFYLNNVNNFIDEVGYFPATEDALDVGRQTLLEANQVAGATLDDPAQYGEGTVLSLAGSSTVFPLSRQMLIEFRRAGYSGDINMPPDSSVGTTGGFRMFCDRNSDISVANASRPIKFAEIQACNEAVRNALEFRVGTDALAVVVSQENDFLTDVTMDELRQIFTGAETWFEINPEWPNEPIVRYIPGADSGTLDFFAETAFSRPLDGLPKESLMAILEQNLSSGLIRRLDNDQPFAERDQANVLGLVYEWVVERRVAKSWNLVDSIFNRSQIEAEVAEIPNGELEFRSWLTFEFLTTPQSSTPDLAGIRTAIIGSLWVILITMLVSLPLGVGAAIYLEEYASAVGNPILRRINNIIQTNINNLAGVPSIIYGMLGLAIFVRVMEPLTSGALFGATDPTTANGRTILSAGLTLALLILPLIIINAQEAIRAVPHSLRQAGMGLGATKWQTIWHHVLPNAIPGILTGNILAVSRALGETAPLVVIGASTFITIDPNGPFSKFTTLPIQIYQWVARPQDEFRNIAAAAIIVLLVLLLTLNASAVLLRNRFSRRLS